MAHTDIEVALKKTVVMAYGPLCGVVAEKLSRCTLRKIATELQ